MEIIRRFKAPERWSDYSLVCFFVQLTVIIIVSFLVFRGFIYGNPEFKEYASRDSAIASFITNMHAEKGEERLLRKIPSLASDEEYVKTDKFIDIKNGGLWLTERQDGTLGIILIGICFSGVILVFVGAGPAYRSVRHIIFVITMKMKRYFIFLFPFGIWGVIVSTILAIAGYLTLMLSPLILLAHLVLGIIQIRNLKMQKAA